MPHKVAALSHMDTLGPEVLEIGSMNTVVVTGFVDEDDGSRRPKLEGRNTDVDGIRGALLSSLPEEERTKDKPFGEGRSAIISASLCSVPPDAGELTAGCVAVGGGGTTRAAVYALSSMGLSPLWLINRDPVETAAILSTPAFARYDLRALEREEQWGEDEAERVACGVGAIPSFEPQTEGERNVYRLAETVFASSGTRSGRGRPLVRVFSCANLGGHSSQTGPVAARDGLQGVPASPLSRPCAVLTRQPLAAARHAHVHARTEARLVSYRRCVWLNHTLTSTPRCRGARLTRRSFAHSQASKPSSTKPSRKTSSGCQNLLTLGWGTPRRWRGWRMRGGRHGSGYGKRQERPQQVIDPCADGALHELPDVTWRARRVQGERDYDA